MSKEGKGKMAGKDEKATNTDILLGQVIGELSGVKTQMAEQAKSLTGVSESLNGLANHVSELPCQKHEDDIGYLLKSRKEVAENRTYSERSRRDKLRDLFIALVAAAITGGFTLLGVWLGGGQGIANAGG